MQITRIRCWQEDLALSRPYTIAYKTIAAVENVFLVLELSDGRYGIGAASPAPMVTGESIEDTLGALQEQAEALLLGRDIRDIHTLLRRAATQLAGRPAAMAAVDLALHDALGHYLDRPLVEWLGRAQEGMPTSITIGIKETLEEVLAEANEYQQRGFRVIKLKIGQQPEADIETVLALRQAVGPAMTIRVDANQGYTPAQLQAFAHACREAAVEFIEQPFPPAHLHWQRQLPPALSARCAADEDLHALNSALQLLQPPLPYGIFNIKLMKCGGIAEAMHIAAVAERAGIELMWGCNDESIASISGALHAALASPATAYLDLDGSFDLAADRVSGGFILREGRLYTNEQPGLGIRLC